MESSSDRKEEGEQIDSTNGSDAEDIHVSDNDTEIDSEETESNTLER